MISINPSVVLESSARCRDRTGNCLHSFRNKPVDVSLECTAASTTWFWNHVTLIDLDMWATAALVPFFIGLETFPRRATELYLLAESPFLIQTPFLHSVASHTPLLGHIFWFGFCMFRYFHKVSNPFIPTGLHKVSQGFLCIRFSIPFSITSED